MMLIDSMTFSDPKTGAWMKTDVVVEDQLRLRVHLYDGQQIRLNLDQTRALHSALDRVLAGR